MFETATIAPGAADDRRRRNPSPPALADPPPPAVVGSAGEVTPDRNARSPGSVGPLAARELLGQSLFAESASSSYDKA
jgi:hypothetical protein